MNTGMNNGKTIHITYGAIIFILLGLLAAAFFIWYPLQNVKTAKADLGNLPHPTTFLQGTDLDSYNSLESDSREYLLSDALPQLISEVFDAGQEPTNTDVEFLTIQLVRLFKQSHDDIEEKKRLRQLTQALGSPCSYNTSLYSYNNKVIVSQHSQCATQMASMTASVWLKGPGGYSSGWRMIVNHHTTSASLSKSHTKAAGCWNGWGAGSATPENDGENPMPGAGDRQLEECYS